MRGARTCNVLDENFTITKFLFGFRKPLINYEESQVRPVRTEQRVLVVERFLAVPFLPFIQALVGGINFRICSTRNSGLLFASKSFGMLINLMSGNILLAISRISSTSSSNSSLEQIFPKVSLHWSQEALDIFTRTWGAVMSDVRTGLTSRMARAWSLVVVPWHRGTNTCTVCYVIEFVNNLSILTNSVNELRFSVSFDIPWHQSLQGASLPR